MWLSWQGLLTHTGGLSVGMGYLAHSSPSTWWCQRLIHWFPGWDGTQRQAICSSPQGFGAAADETNLINIDREVGGVPHSGCAVGNEVKSKEPGRLSLVLVCAPPVFTKETGKVQESKLENPSKLEGLSKLTGQRSSKRLSVPVGNGKRHIATNQTQHIYDVSTYPPKFLLRYWPSCSFSTVPVFFIFLGVFIKSGKTVRKPRMSTNLWQLSVPSGPIIAWSRTFRALVRDTFFSLWQQF